MATDKHGRILQHPLDGVQQNLWDTIRPLVGDTYSYSSYSRSNQAKYVHRFYSPKLVRNLVQPQEVAALEREVWKQALPDQDFAAAALALEAENCSIRYRAEGLVKEISADNVGLVLNALASWWRDRWDRDFTEEEQTWLLCLNERLRQLEVTIREETNRVSSELASQMAANETFLSDYEIVERVEFYLTNDDPYWDEDDDNLIYQYEVTHGESKRPEWKPNNEVECENHNDKRFSLSNLPLYQVEHCYLFHELESHSPVPIKHLCRIGFIWTDVEVLRQNVFDFGERLGKV